MLLLNVLSQPKQKKLKIALAIVVAVFALYALLGFLAVPYVIQRSLESYATEQLDRKMSIGEVRVNPLLFRLEMKDVALTERDGAPIAGFGRLVADFEISSIGRWAWTFAEIRLEAPALRADIGPDGRLNLAVLMDKFPKAAPRQDARPPRLLLQHVVVSEGSLALHDRSGATPAAAEIRPINFELRDISTIPDSHGAYAVSMRLQDGGAFRWKGDVSLAPLSSQGEVSVKGVRPATAWRFLRDELALEQPRGELDVAARYRMAVDGGTLMLLMDAVHVSGRDLAITAAGDKEPLVALASFEATGGRFDLGKRELVLPSVTLRDGAVAAEVDAQGGINWAKLVKAAPGDSGTASVSGTRKAAAPWKATIESLQMAGIRLRYVDGSRMRPVRVDAKEMTMKLAATAEGASGGTRVALDGVGLTLVQPSLRYVGTDEQPIAFDTIALEGGRFDLEQRQVTLGQVTVTGGAIRAVRDKSGAVPLLDDLAGRDAGLVRREVGDTVERAKAEGRAWRVVLDALEVSGTRLALSDLGFGEPVAYDGQNLRARLNGFQSDGKKPVKIDASLDFAQGGSLAASGVLQTNGEAFNGRVKVTQFNLKPLAPVLASRVRAQLVSGELSAEIKADYRARGGRHELRAAGPLSIDNVLLNESGTGEQLLGWKRLALSGMQLGLAPNGLTIEEARLSGLGAKIVVFKDRSLNLAKAVIPDPGAASPLRAADAPPREAVTTADLEPLFPVTIERVTVENGAVNFSDLSLVLPFAANVTELGGTVQGIGTDRVSRASVRLEGRVDQYGLARVSGSLRPFRPTAYLDFGVTFRNVEMSPLSPYTATFAGRRIASGRLSLDLQYKINEGMLAGDNKVVLQDLKLGERVDAPGAKDLPLDLAVALLTDSEGKIDVSLPVSGNVNDPQFSYGQVVWQAIANLIGRIVTAPFRALGALFGGAENLDSIAFDPARAALLPPEREKLKRLAEGLAKRPQLRLVVEGQHGPADRKALQEYDVERAVAARLGRPVAVGVVPEPANVTDAKTQRALEGLFIERQSEQALQQFVAESGKARGKPVERVNPALALVGRASADRDFYEALLKRLIEAAPVPEDTLSRLAADRARAVSDHLTKVLAVAAARVATRSATGAPQVKLTLEAPQATAAAGVSAR